MVNDDELLARMRAIDPARTSEAPSPDPQLLLEATVTADTRVSPTEQSAGGESRRRFLPIAVGAALLVVVAGLTWGVTSRDTPPSPSAAATPAAPALTLTVPDAPAAKCAPVTVDLLRGVQTAFEGTATAVKGDRVELGVDRWYRGSGPTTVRLTSDAKLAQLLSGAEFAVGRHYLVAANDGRVTLCGSTAEATPQLRALYEQAYTG
ncbi:hypothetical protein ACIP98_34010 [Streptomyces sp. NPDC088354]|uniref:hypothetical protein n=1 Tax=unclassified Streptomyces TaxID=2593676 RepID=UPI0029A853C7|nr:hypothetical protein [Streptomyces sp. MI02-7b]MDX3077652.1 hypothetical protein [Streptomyces sp. MI02-7b]